MNTERIVSAVMDYTMTSREAVEELVRLVDRVVRLQIPGALVECGVCRGGSMMAIAMALLDLGVKDRELWLFDTFEGNPRPQEVDVSYKGASAVEWWEKEKTGENSSTWCYGALPDVRANMARTGYPSDKIHYVKGLVEATLPCLAPGQIALLRLDTDFYSSTKIELETLYPRLSVGGVLIVDDWNYWAGSKKAAEEYLAAHASTIAMLDGPFPVKIGVKPC